ncbi:LLM class flavin-dependent oxidoreductase, partial [Rhizobiaceae sp. 2RAB30]
PAFEPTTLVSSLATVTERIGLVAAASMFAFQPYNLARRFASLDIISHGRTGWLATLSPETAEAAHFSRWSGIGAENLGSRSEEFLRVVTGLWQGWDADALLFDKAAGRFFDPSKMHLLGHQGANFSVRGPLNVARSPQDRPILVLSGVSEGNVELAAGLADIVLSEARSMEEAAGLRRLLKQRAAALGRDPGGLRLLVRVTTDIGTPEALATSGRIEFRGTPSEIAEAMEQAWRSGTCDGFDIAAGSGGPPDDFVEHVMPELHRRGLVRGDSAGETLRSRLDFTTEARP